VAGGEDEAPDALGGQQARDVPDDRPAADLDERLGHLAPQPRPAAAAEDDGVHTARMLPQERAARAAAYESARPEILALVPRGARRVLDLGCATGALGAALDGASVTGVEVEPQYAAEAEARLDRVICADAEALARGGDLEARLGRFDVLVAGDVLEHLVDPWTALRAYAALLEPGGTAVISLPNVNHWTAYAALARGTWPRRAQGIFDATHLRWFTLRDARALLEQAGLRPAEVVSRPWVLWRGTGLDRHAAPLLRIPGLRALLTYQHVIAAVPSP
jgi:2-polyprenyl-3-methyl-5-hydroxy-6-metoxy-1,4-benzoquinol methylase